MGDRRTGGRRLGRRAVAGAAAGALAALLVAGAGGPAGAASGGAGIRGDDGRGGAGEPVRIATDATAYDVNERGVVVGVRYVDGGMRAFRWQRGRPLVELGPGIAHGVNDAGTVVGSSGGQAVRWERDGTTVPLASGWVASEATDVDSRGTVVGNAVLPDGSARAFVRRAGSAEVELLPAPPGHEGDSLSAAAINERGTIVGAIQVHEGEPSSVGVVWRGRDHRPTVLPGTGDTAYVGDVNDRGVIVGATTEGPDLWGLRWTSPDRPPQRIGRDGTAPIARAINERGLVVGVEYSSGTPFQWDPRTGRTWLLTDLGGGYADAWAVNDRGVAVGTSTPPASLTSDAVVFGRAVPPTDP